MNSQTRALTAYYAVLFAVGLMAGCLGPAIPMLAANTGSPLSSVSLVFSVRPAGYLAGTLLAGRLFDRMPGHPILLLALLLAAAALTMTPLMASLTALTVLTLLLGLADGTLDVGANTLLPWVFGDKAGPYFNGLHFCFGIGALTAPVLIERSLHFTGGMQGAFRLMGLLALPIAAALFFIPSPHHLAPSAPEAAGPAARVDRPTLALIVLIFLAYGGAESAFGNWIFSYAKARGLADDAGAAYLTSLFWGSVTLGRLAAIPIARKAPQPKVLLVDALLCAASLAALLLWPQSRALLWLGSAGLGLGMASFFPTLVAYSGRRLAPHGRVSGGITSLFFVGSSSGSILLPWVIGRGFETLGPGMAPGVIGCAVLSMNILLLLLLRKP